MKKTISIAMVFVIVLSTELAKADFIVGAPTNLGDTVNSPFWEGCVNISADGLELYFDSPRPGGDGDFDLYDIYVTKRSSIDSNWSEPENLGPPVNSTDNDSGPSISADGLQLYFSSTRPGGYGDDDLWVATRPTTADQWGEPVNLGPTVNGPNWDYFPSISADGLELYFTSNRPGNHGFVDIWVSTRATTEDDWKEPVNLGPPVNDTTWAESPSISTDGLTLFFESDRPGGVGHNDIWMTRRVTRDHSWGEPVCLAAPANSPWYEKQPDISADGRTLYFGHFDDVDGPWDLWQVSIEPVVDLNNDGIVDAEDMCIVVDNWGTDNKLCDVGPMPWGDGVVDVEDLIVIAEHPLFPGLTQILFDNETDLLAAADVATTYDFEEASGFPASDANIGLFDGIDFDADTHAFALAISGTQTMTGNDGNPDTPGTSDIATLDFTGLATQPVGFGFWGLDLTISPPEVIRVNIDYTSGSSASYDVQIPEGGESFDPVYFGLINSADTIDTIELFGTRPGQNPPRRAWSIDDLTIVSVLKQ